MALNSRACWIERRKKKDRLAADATLANEVTLVQTCFRCRPNAFIWVFAKTQGMADRQQNVETSSCFSISCAIHFH